MIIGIKSWNTGWLTMVHQRGPPAPQFGSRSWSSSELMGEALEIGASLPAESQRESPRHCDWHRVGPAIKSGREGLASLSLAKGQAPGCRTSHVYSFPGKSLTAGQWISQRHGIRSVPKVGGSFIMPSPWWSCGCLGTSLVLDPMAAAQFTSKCNEMYNEDE